jgi:hypothetical protein
MKNNHTEKVQLERTADVKANVVEDFHPLLSLVVPSHLLLFNERRFI